MGGEVTMSRFRKFLLASSGVVVLSVILSVSGMGAAIAESAKPLLVRIVNTTDEPVPTSEVPPEPVALGQRLIGLNQDHHTLMTVPEGKQLVIEFITVAASMGSHLRPAANINVTSSGKNSQHGIGFSPVNTADGITSYQGTHQVRLYADPGTAVTFFIGFSPRDPEWDDRIAAVSLSGYLVDAPAGS